MITQSNNEVKEFNNSKKNVQRVMQSEGYAFISCPDFSHQDGRYTFRTMSNGIPLSFSVAEQGLQQLSETKPVRVYISDHAGDTVDIRNRLNIPLSIVEEMITTSLEKIKSFTSSAQRLSNFYSYQQVSDAKLLVPEDYQMELAIIRQSDTGRSRIDLINRYKEKYAQFYVFMKSCKDNNFCPVFLYSKHNLGFISAIRKILTVPVILLEAADPH